MENLKLHPAEVFHYFAEICKVPRPSKHEGKIIEYLRGFAARHNLPCKVDEAGNVLITKAATPGCEWRKTVVLQSHIDMVCEKNADTDHDFTRDPIRTYVDGEWLKARGTTLGADNGIGVATELAILASDTIEHGPIECLFTVDEETGLTGAFALKPGFITGEMLINLDSEDEGEIFIGCAGGINTTADFTYTDEPVPAGYAGLRINVGGLTGGHSGDDIDKGRANANKLLNRLLCTVARQTDMRLCTIDGGNLHNAIPREAEAVIAVPDADKERVRVALNIFTADVEDEYAATEPNVRLTLESVPAPATAIDRDTARRLLDAVHGVWSGVYAMSRDIPGLVETSTNLASVKMKAPGHITIVTSQRSSVTSARDDMRDTVAAVFRLAGAEVVSNDGYPGWKPNPGSPLLKIAAAAYRRLFGTDPKVKAIHAGLECGLFLEKYPSLDMVSFGPTLRGVHSPDERMLIPTVDKFWRHLLAVLADIPARDA